MALILKPRNPFREYPQFEGETPFEKAANEKMKTYWEVTKKPMPMETACFEVLSEMYNKLDAMINLAQESAEPKPEKPGKKGKKS